MSYKAEIRCTMLDIKKAYKIANDGLFGFQKWADNNGLNELMYEKASNPIEESFLFDTFSKQFSKWVEKENLHDWNDVVCLIRKSEKNGRI